MLKNKKYRLYRIAFAGDIVPFTVALLCGECRHFVETYDM